MTRQELIDHPGISISSLKMIKYNPLGFYKRKILGEKEETEQTASQKLGTLIDEALLTPLEFEERYAFIPDGVTEPTTKYHINFCDTYLNIQAEPHKYNPPLDYIPVTTGPWMWETAYRRVYSTKGKNEIEIQKDSLELYTKYLSWLSWKYQNPDKEVISKSDHDIIAGISERLNKNPRALELLQNSSEFETDIHEQFYTQLALVRPIRTKEGIFDVKGLLDVVLVDDEKKVVKVIDLKSTGMGLTSAPNVIKRWGYHQQLQFYAMLASGHDDLKDVPKDYKIEFYIVFVRTKPDYEVLVAELGGKVMEEAKNDIYQMIEDMYWHKDNDSWEHPRSMPEGYTLITDWDHTWDGENNSDQNGTEFSETNLDESILASLDFE